MRLFSIIVLSMLVAVVEAQPADQSDAVAQIAIVIDDLGDRLHDGQRVIDLVGDVTIGIIPYTPYARRLAQYAEQQQKEVMLHLPMEAISGKYLGRGGLDTSMDQSTFFSTLQRSLSFLPNIHGVNNHMGSRLTQDPEKMRWLMQGLRDFGGLYFLDSRTIDTSQAMQVADQSGLRNATRDVFLDHDRNIKTMQHQWHYFIQLAKQKGSAICIAHPYPESVAFLAEKLAGLDQSGIRLMKVSELIRWREDRRKLAWHTSTSLSH